MPGESTSAADLAAITSGAATPEETSATLEQLESPAYLTPWGLRSKPTTARDYDPVGYAKGSVWGHGTAAAAGNAFTPQRESVPEQTWSSAGFLSATIRGMLGLRSDARNNVLQFAPKLPQSWQTVRVERVRVGKSVVHLDWQATHGRVILDVHNSGPAFRLRWTQPATGKHAPEPAVLERDILPGKTRMSVP